MADTPTPTPNPEPPKNKRKREQLNQAQLQALSKADQICLSALKPEYAGALNAREITGAFIGQLQADINAARLTGGNAVQTTTNKTEATSNETEAARNLVYALQEVQTAAKQKYARTDRDKMRDYFVGQRLDNNRASLEQTSSMIIQKLDDDTLPGITAEKVTNLTALRQAYVQANSTQTGAQTNATLLRANLASAVQSINDRRITIQLAADAEWSYKNPANIAIRKEFGLPANQRFSA